jgi:lipoprotein signal peptidase
MTKRNLFVALLGVTILLLGFCLISKSWFAQRIGHGEYAGEVVAGMWTVRACAGGECESKSLSELADLTPGRDQGRHRAFAIFGQITFFLTALTVLLALAVVAAALRKPQAAPRLAKLAMLAATADVFAGMVFVINKPEILNASWGVAAFLTAAIVGVVATAVLARPETYLVGGGRDPSIPRL